MQYEGGFGLESTNAHVNQYEVRDTDQWEIVKFSLTDIAGTHFEIYAQADEVINAGSVDQLASDYLIVLEELVTEPADEREEDKKDIETVANRFVKNLRETKEWDSDWLEEIYNENFGVLKLQRIYQILFEAEEYSDIA